MPIWWHGRWDGKLWDRLWHGRWDRLRWCGYWHAYLMMVSWWDSLWHDKLWDRLWHGKLWERQEERYDMWYLISQSTISSHLSHNLPSHLIITSRIKVCSSAGCEVSSEPSYHQISDGKLVRQILWDDMVSWWGRYYDGRWDKKHIFFISSTIISSHL